MAGFRLKLQLNRTRMTCVIRTSNADFSDPQIHPLVTMISC